jgi:hypothetical protein
MFGDFTKGFWVSIYHGRIPDAPMPSMRVMTSDVLDGISLPNDGLPRFHGRPARFLFRLLWTWATMGFANPRVAGVPE